MATPTTLLDLLTSTPAERTAIILPEQNIRVTYGGLRKQVTAVAETLAAAGITRGDRVVELRGEVRGVDAGLGFDAALQDARIEGGVTDDAGDAAQNEDQRQRTHELGLQRQFGGRIPGGFFAHPGLSGRIGRDLSKLPDSRVCPGDERSGRNLPPRTAVTEVSVRAQSFRSQMFLNRTR